MLPSWINFLTFGGNSIFFFEKGSYFLDALFILSEKAPLSLAIWLLISEVLNEMDWRKSLSWPMSRDKKSSTSLSSLKLEVLEVFLSDEPLRLEFLLKWSAFLRSGSLIFCLSYFEDGLFALSLLVKRVYLAIPFDSFLLIFYLPVLGLATLGTTDLIVSSSMNLRKSDSL